MQGFSNLKNLNKPSSFCLARIRTHAPEESRNNSSLWRHNGRNGVSNHQRHDCLLNHSLRRRSKKTSKLCITGLCAWNSPVTGEFPHKWPVMLKMLPFDDVIMLNYNPSLWWPSIKPTWRHCRNWIISGSDDMHTPDTIRIFVHLEYKIYIYRHINRVQGRTETEMSIFSGWKQRYYHYYCTSVCAVSSETPNWERGVTTYRTKHFGDTFKWIF